MEITATLVYSTPVAYVWVEDGQEYDQAAIARSIDRFSSVTYPDDVNTFGSEWHPGVDNDPRLHILYNTQMGTGRRRLLLGRRRIRAAGRAVLEPEGDVLHQSGCR